MLWILWILIEVQILKLQVCAQISLKEFRSAALHITYLQYVSILRRNCWDLRAGMVDSFSSVCVFALSLKVPSGSPKLNSCTRVQETRDRLCFISRTYHKSSLVLLSHTAVLKIETLTEWGGWLWIAKCLQEVCYRGLLEQYIFARVFFLHCSVKIIYVCLFVHSTFISILLVLWRIPDTLPPPKWTIDTLPTISWFTLFHQPT